MSMIENEIASGMPVSSSPVPSEGHNDINIMVIEVDVSDGCFEVRTAYNDVQVTVVVCSTASVAELKKCIAEEFGLDADEMRLIIKGSDDV